MGGLSSFHICRGLRESNIHLSPGAGPTPGDQPGNAEFEGEYMRLILVGCEYVGNTTLANAIDDWMDITIGARFSLIHEHWKIPHTSGHPDNTTPEEQAWLLAATPKFKEMHQRHSLYYHAHGWVNPDVMMVGAAIEDAVYAPMFFDYGGKGEFQDREVVMHEWEATILATSDEITLVHVTAETEVIRQRMQDGPHENMVISEGDIERVKSRFAELVDWSTIPNKIAIDNSGPVADTMAEFVSKIEPYLTEEDRSRMDAKTRN